jgi:hypothetical protein
MESRTNYLQIRYLWNDENYMEIELKANNERFSGEASVGTSSDYLLHVADELNGFPFSKDRLIFSLTVGYSSYCLYR